jgi:hypothetical protein
VFIDIHCAQEKKYNQNAYGDSFRSRMKPEEGRVIAVLSDGLGSGIKANILSLMTATMLLRFVEEDFEITKAAEIVMNSLPVCKVRKISYATFSAVECDDDGNVHLVEEGNPDFIWMRGTEVVPVHHRIVPSKAFPERQLKIYRFQVEEGDRLVFCSDGVTQAGLGRRGPYMTGLKREGLIELLKTKLRMHKNISSTELSMFIVQSALAVYEDGLAKDDVSAGVIYFRTPRRAVIFTGAPYDQRQDAHYATNFDKFPGKKAVCGGTTATLLGRELGRKVTINAAAPAGDLPPQLLMPGVDLVTEGILTLTRALTYLENRQLGRRDPAGALTDFMLASDVIHFMVGVKLNQAHYDPRQPVDFEIRREVIRKITSVLKDKYLKKTTVQYI